MCLSTAYRNEKGEDAVLARYVAQVEVRGKKVLLTDVVGAETEVEGFVSFVDLTGGTVIIRTDVV